MDLVKIFDTTLRDGEQSPGCSMTIGEKLEMAKQLAYLNVDIIEAGFAISSKGDFESIQTIAKEVKGPSICSLARARQEDIDAAWEAVRLAKNPRIHVFLATSPLHMKYKLNKGEDEVVAIAIEAVKYAKKYCSDIEFSAEDAGRSDRKFLYRILSEVIKAGAVVINVPDTVGYTLPHEFGELIKDVKANTEGIEKVDLSVHCHNDLGMAVANSISAVINGATQVECAINGIGERAGNASLEEIVMAIYTRGAFINKKTNIKTTEIYRTSKLLSSITGVQVQPNKAIVGANAFLHESGIHQDGVLKNRMTYEIMSAELIGLREQELVLGKHSGRHAFKQRLIDLGFHLTEEQLERGFVKFKALADEKKVVTDKDIESLISNENTHFEEKYKLEYVQVTAGNTTKPTATVRISNKDGEIFEDACIGTGPVDAIYNAIEQLVGVKFNLQEYIVHAVTGGTDALGEVTVRIKEGNDLYTGRGSDTDVLVSTAQAFLSAINKFLYYK
ncbi:MAG: 2-isopropylmalate synthase [Candidatus Margulisbacteria bacterium]|nr:2-isopropylmalate synthase [Candidatus Margulisiibacteriota bacterium]